MPNLLEEQEKQGSIERKFPKNDTGQQLEENLRQILKRKQDRSLLIRNTGQ